jgi:hypothetical protein
VWIYIPPVSSTPSHPHFPVPGSPSSPAQKALALASTLRRRTLDLTPLLPFVTWNGKSPHAASLRRALQTDVYARLQFGVISQPLMEECFVGWLTASTGVSRARTLALRASGRGLKTGTRRGCGLSTSALLKTFGLDTSLLKTYPEFSRGRTGPGSLGNLPGSGTMRNGALRERIPLAVRMDGNECGYWPTATSAMTTGAGEEGRDGGMNLQTAAVMWPTADANTSSYSNGERGMNLREAAAQWGTPQAHDIAPGKAERVGRYGTKHGGRNLTDNVAAWVTPAARDYRTPNLHPYASRGGKTKGEQLANQVAHSPFSLPSPPSPSSLPDPKTGTHGLAYSEVVQTLHRLYPPEAGPRRLNPAFVDWLMGWPQSWTVASRVSALEEMASWQSAALRHLSICGID